MITIFNRSKDDAKDSNGAQFKSLGLSEDILKALLEKGYETPTPIQEKAIPVVLNGDDLMAAAQTGTGKTAGFTLPILHQLSKVTTDRGKRPVRVLILTPTRELASQILDSVALYGKYLPLRSMSVFGGVNINPQKQRLKKGVDILVATPGRLLDLFQQRAVSFNQIETLVLDEADRMLDMGFIHDIKRIINLLPKDRQTLLFSATFSNPIQKLAQQFLSNPIEISVTPKNAAAATVKQSMFSVEKKQKSQVLYHLITKNHWDQVLVFSRTKHGANKLTKFLDKNGINASAIHGNKSQSARTKALADFKLGTIQVLVATDIASRGLDINELPQVVNFELPHVPEDYVHRIGRTGRAGSEGQAVSLVSSDESKQLRDIERLIKKKLPQESLSGFEPVAIEHKENKASRPFRRRRPKQQQRKYKTTA
ncbi:ATP-dependent RNA helicase RhlE [Candidatus Marinamargulisbacteria bacterium SCGC AG-343-K17]|nr:ATP-dependent RNA helicase RhlE [Candidatus Marinamargulisbacteria bacterium SCGC AG-343-K17]